MKTISLIATFWLLAISNNFSQTISGTVTDQNSEETITGVLVRVMDTTVGTFTDENGEFEFNLDNQFDYPLQITSSIVGYQTDTLEINSPGTIQIQLQSNSDIEAVVVSDQRKNTQVDLVSAQHVEVMGEGELLKAACCNLSESFENSATVDVNFNDAVTGSKQITLLGLDGVYTQMNWENMPLVRGLGEYYGLSFVPGTWIESIQVGKGAGSVVNGFESMTGQINVEFRKPDTMPEFFINGYQNLQGRSELNSHFGKQLNKKWSTGLFLHGSLVNGDADNNDDGFNDRTKGGQVNVFNRWKYVSDGNYRGQFGARFIHDEKVGGQIGFKKDDAISPSGLYGVDVESDRFEVFAKNGLIFPEKPWKSVGFIVNASHHDQDARFGLNSLLSSQKSLYSNLIYQTIIGDTRHILKSGANFQYDNFKEELNSVTNEREFIVPGVFTEYTYDNLNNLKIVGGLRADYINTVEQFELSPRIHMKWNSENTNTNIRLSGGRGFRSPNIYADAPTLLVSSRDVVLEENPEIESSWNYGASFTQYFDEQKGILSADFFRTEFENQIIRDFYSSADEVRISNLDGDSYANSLQVSTDYELFERFDLRLAYKRDDVQQEIDGELVQKQLTPKHRGLINTAYALPFDRWKFDATLQYVGEQRLPTTMATEGSSLTDATYSPDYYRFNSQVTKKFGDWDVYVGGENLLNYRQDHPIVDAENPFGDDFDASSVWGPIQGRNVYLGFRYEINKE